MRQPAADNEVRAIGLGVERAFLLVAALCVLAMPSLYRGGASVPHAHGFLQFWLAGPERAFDHHRGLAGHEHGDHADHSAASVEGDGQSTANAPRDEPAVSPSTAPGGAIVLMTMSIAALLAVGVVNSGRWRYPVVRARLTGRFLTPDPPPPRHAVVA